MDSKALEVLKKYFGYSEFRSGQEKLVESILRGKDTVGIMPTGAGKSICYQVPAMLFEGITIVVSPLIALMKDQVKSLNEAGIHAAFLNSSLSPIQYHMALENARQYTYKVIYVAPERLLTRDFINFATSVDISMVVVDEAHCISQWGQDFRPSYLDIREFVNKLPQKPVLSAFTATATKKVAKDIIRALGMKKGLCLTTSFDRANLFFEVRRNANRFEEVCKYITEHKDDSGIIYCATRKNVDEVYQGLMKEGASVTHYHAGLADEEKDKSQDAFIFDNKKIMVATNAFGMGIDKSNVRYVIHYNMPKDMESYYQEAGRAGRDGENADCILFYSPQDVKINQFLIENSKDESKIDLDVIDLEMIKNRQLQRLKKMTMYANMNDCLREYILNYFGQKTLGPCENCSNCSKKFIEKDVTEICKAVISCISESGEKYGISTIAQTLLGAQTARISSYGLNNNSFYGSHSMLNLSTLSEITNYMIYKGYISVTDDKYPIAKLTNLSYEILHDKLKVQIKLSSENTKVNVKIKSKNKGLISFDNDQKNLFEDLRKLRYAIAQEEKVPPYIIFSDKTLIDMCEKEPKTSAEFMMISGVGTAKNRKYGERFLAVINEESK